MPRPAATPPIRTAAEAGAYLAGLINVEKERHVSYARFSIEPIRRLAERLGNPHTALSVIHIAGSKGKGSTALFAEALLRAAGERVGTFTSPHLERWTERFRIDGREVDGAKLAAAVARVAPHVDAMRQQDPACAPTFFDAITAAALLLFRDAEVDRVVLEVGLGGRLDSTNLVTPAVACITGIELEHTEQLGGSLAEIAGEKAGILKPGVPAVVGALPDEAAAVIEARAREIGAPLARFGRDFTAQVLESDFDGQRLRLVDGPIRTEVRVPVLGDHQPGNAALALACARRAARDRDTELAAAAPPGFAAAVLPGRIELIRRAPWILVDSAHTAASAEALAAVLRRIPNRRMHLVLAVSAGKDVMSILGSLLPLANALTVTIADPKRSLAPDEVARSAAAVAPDLAVEVAADPRLALTAARDALGPADLLCVAGSIYLAGIARGVLLDPGPGPGAGGAARSARSPLGNR